MHKPTPPGWPQMVPCLFYREPAAAIDWLCAAFGFALRLKVEGELDEIVYSELTYGVKDVEGHPWWFMQRLRHQPAKP